MRINNTEDVFREGYAQYFLQGSDPEIRKKGFLKIRSAADQNHVEAMFHYGLILLHDTEMARLVSQAERGQAWGWVYRAASCGSMTAKHFLDKVCRERYEKAFPPSGKTSGPLKDFDGKEIRIRRTGLRTPVDAVLSYENGENILTLQVDLLFADEGVFPDEKDAEVFRNAVMDGIREWEGVYEVFGGQTVRIRIRLSVNENLYDHVSIIPLTKEQEANALKLAEKSPWGNPDQITHSAALTAFGLRGWSVVSRKLIFFRNPDRMVKNPEHLRHIAKHEFGHVIGLGDLYQSEVFGLGGTDSSNVPELKTYEIMPKEYYLVMSNAFGPISNNDVEMVILAFSENRMQSYQPDRVNKFASKALGRGN